VTVFTTQPGVLRISSARSEIFLSLEMFLESADAGILQALDDLFVDVNPGNHNGLEEIALAGFRPRPMRGSSKSGIQHRLGNPAAPASGPRLQHELDEFLSPLPLHQQFAAFVKTTFMFCLFSRGEPRVGAPREILKPRELRAVFKAPTPVRR